MYYVRFVIHTVKKLAPEYCGFTGAKTRKPVNVNRLRASLKTYGTVYINAIYIFDEVDCTSA